MTEGKEKDHFLDNTLLHFYLISLIKKIMENSGTFPHYDWAKHL